MALFQSKQDKEAKRVAKLVTELSNLHKITIKDVLDEFSKAFNLGDALQKDESVLDGIFIWHDALVIGSLSSIKDKSKEELATDALWAYQESMIATGDIKVPIKEYAASANKAINEYINAHRSVQGGNKAVPSMRLIHSIKQMDELDIDIISATTILPPIERYVLDVYKNFWNKSL